MQVGVARQPKLTSARLPKQIDTMQLMRRNSVDDHRRFIKEDIRPCNPSLQSLRLLLPVSLPRPPLAVVYPAGAEIESLALYRGQLCITERSVWAR